MNTVLPLFIPGVFLIEVNDTGINLRLHSPHIQLMRHDWFLHWFRQCDPQTDLPSDWEERDMQTHEMFNYVYDLHRLPARLFMVVGDTDGVFKRWARQAGHALLFLKDNVSREDYETQHNDPYYIVARPQDTLQTVAFPFQYILFKCRQHVIATRIQRWWRHYYWNPASGFCRERIRRSVQQIDTDVVMTTF